MDAGRSRPQQGPLGALQWTSPQDLPRSPATKTQATPPGAALRQAKRNKPDGEQLSSRGSPPSPLSHRPRARSSDTAGLRDSGLDGALGNGVGSVFPRRFVFFSRRRERPSPAASDHALLRGRRPAVASGPSTRLAGRLGHRGQAAVPAHGSPLTEGPTAHRRAPRPRGRLLVGRSPRQRDASGGSPVGTSGVSPGPSSHVCAVSWPPAGPGAGASPRF